MRTKLISGDEYAALTKARRFYKYLTRPGVTARIKRAYRRRLRKELNRNAVSD